MKTWNRQKSLTSNTFSSEQNGHHLRVWLAAIGQLMACGRTGEKPLTQIMMTQYTDVIITVTS